MSRVATKRNVPSIAERVRQYNEQARRQAEQLAALMPNGLAAFIEDCFEGRSTIVNVGAAVNAEAAERAIVAAIEPHFETRLSAQQLAAIGREVILMWNRRADERRAGLADIQSRLASPAGRMFA